jgi:hypothetical protein
MSEAITKETPEQKVKTYLENHIYFAKILRILPETVQYSIEHMIERNENILLFNEHEDLAKQNIDLFEQQLVEIGRVYKTVENYHKAIYSEIIQKSILEKWNNVDIEQLEKLKTSPHFQEEDKELINQQLILSKAVREAIASKNFKDSKVQQKIDHCRFTDSKKL